MDLHDLEQSVRAMELEMIHRLNAIFENHGLTGAMTFLVNLGTGFLAKALVMTPRESRDNLLMTMQIMIDSRTEEGDAVVQSAMQAGGLGSTCRPH